MPEKIVHEILLDGYTARFCGVGARLRLGTYGSYGVEQLHIVLGERWQGLTVYANFVTDSGTTPVLVPESGLVDVPPEATAKPGFGSIVLDGTADGARIYSVDILYLTLKHSALTGEAPAPTPDRWEQYVAQVKQYFRCGSRKCRQRRGKRQKSQRDCRSRGVLGVRFRPERAGRRSQRAERSGKRRIRGEKREPRAAEYTKRRLDRRVRRRRNPVHGTQR